jgi:hypothetical protein
MSSGLIIQVVNLRCHQVTSRAVGKLHLHKFHTNYELSKSAHPPANEARELYRSVVTRLPPKSH